jgi:hypothetical protein
LVDGVADVRLTRLRNERNLGVAPTFNRAFDVAAERAVDIVTIFHADDVLEPDYVATLRAAHAQFPDAACVAPNATVIDAAGRPVRPLPDRVKQWLWPRRRTELAGERGLALLLRGQFLYCPAVSYRMTAVRAQVVPRWNERWGQVMDLELYARTVLAGGSIALERRPVYRYRRHADTTTERNSAGLVRTEEETALCKALAAEATRKGWYRAARAGRRRITVRARPWCACPPCCGPAGGPMPAASPASPSPREQPRPRPARPGPPRPARPGISRRHGVAPRADVATLFRSVWGGPADSGPSRRRARRAGEDEPGGGGSRQGR